MNPEWAKFAATLFPELLGFAIDLFKRHGNNAAAARLEVRRVRDHGTAFLAQDSANREEMEQLKDGSK
jgi:hypothetical protein